MEGLRCSEISKELGLSGICYEIKKDKGANIERSKDDEEHVVLVVELGAVVCILCIIWNNRNLKTKR